MKKLQELYCKSLADVENIQLKRLDNILFSKMRKCLGITKSYVTLKTITAVQFTSLKIFMYNVDYLSLRNLIKSGDNKSKARKS